MTIFNLTDEYLREHADITNPEYLQMIDNATREEIKKYNDLSPEEKALFIKEHAYQSWLGLSDEETNDPNIQSLVGDFLAANHKSMLYSQLNQAITEALSVKQGNDYQRNEQGNILRLPGFETFKKSNQTMINSIDADADKISNNIINRKSHKI